MNRAVFFDRDGILNKVVFRGDTVGSPRSLDELELMDGVRELVGQVRALGYLAIMVTNQPDVGRGLLAEDELERIHNHLKEQLGLDDIEVCTSGEDADQRRKPNPGMLLDACRKRKIDPGASFFIGDSIKDIVAGKRARVPTILLETEYNLNIHGAGDYNCDALSHVLPIIRHTFVSQFLCRAKDTIDALNVAQIESAVHLLRRVRDEGGRLFLIGSGGGAGHASHATCDFRKLCGIEAYCPTDNVSELTARINDEGWDNSIAAYLRGSKIGNRDCLLVFSVGGGNAEHNVSVNLVNAVKLAKEVGASVVGVVGRDGGYTAKCADACILVPPLETELITPLTESFQALIWHLIVSHPLLQQQRAKWESLTPTSSHALTENISERRAK